MDDDDKQTDHDACVRRQAQTNIARKRQGRCGQGIPKGRAIERASGLSFGSRSQRSLTIHRISCKSQKNNKNRWKRDGFKIEKTSDLASNESYVAGSVVAVAIAKPAGLTESHRTVNSLFF